MNMLGFKVYFFMAMRAINEMVFFHFPDLFQETSGNDTRREGKKCYAGEGYYSSKDLTYNSNRNHITIPDGCQCNHRPPEGAWNAAKFLGFGFMLCKIHEAGGDDDQSGGEHQADQ